MCVAIIISQVKIYADRFRFTHLEYSLCFLFCSTLSAKENRILKCALRWTMTWLAVPLTCRVKGLSIPICMFNMSSWTLNICAYLGKGQDVGRGVQRLDKEIDDWFCSPLALSENDKLWFIEPNYLSNGGSFLSTTLVDKAVINTANTQNAPQVLNDLYLS